MGILILKTDGERSSENRKCFLQCVIGCCCWPLSCLKTHCHRSQILQSARKHVRIFGTQCVDRTDKRTPTNVNWMRLGIAGERMWSCSTLGAAQAINEEEWT